MLKKVGKYAFLECGALKEITIPAATIVEKDPFDPSVTEVVRNHDQGQDRGDMQPLEDVNVRQIVENRPQLL